MGFGFKRETLSKCVSWRVIKEDFSSQPLVVSMYLCTHVHLYLYTYAHSHIREQTQACPSYVQTHAKKETKKVAMSGVDVKNFSRVAGDEILFLPSNFHFQWYQHYSSIGGFRFVLGCGTEYWMQSILVGFNCQLNTAYSHLAGELHLRNYLVRFALDMSLGMDYLHC